MCVYSCELIKAHKLVMRQNFYTTDDTAFENRLVWLLSFTEVTIIQTHFDLCLNCLRADISYFLCCMQKRDVCVTPSLIVFQLPAGFPRSWEHAVIG